MKRKMFITAAVMSTMVLQNSVSASGFDTNDVTFYIADSYEEGIAPILFGWNDLLYKGYIDENGELLFYVEWDFEKECSRDFWNLEELNSATFEGGYSWFERGDKRYIINTAGEIVSSYNRQDVLCTGGGYTWVVAKIEASWDNPGGYSFILYKPNGEVETSLDFDFNTYESWQVDNIRRDLEEYEFHYFGQGVFGSKYYDKFYFVKSGIWVDYDNVQWYYKNDEWLKFDENKYVVLNYDEDSEGSYVIFIDANGTLQRTNVPGAGIYGLDRYYLEGISENRILFSSGNVLYNFNISENQWYVYDGQFADYVFTYELGSTHSEINNNCYAFAIIGADQKSYVALDDYNTYEEYGPIYIKDRDAFSLKQDVLVIENDTETQLLDFQGNILSTYDNGKDVQYVGHGLVMCMPENDGWAEYYRYDGTKLFEEYDFSNAIDLGTLIN